jgi:hypothetical protein
LQVQGFRQMMPQQSYASGADTPRTALLAAAILGLVFGAWLFPSDVIDPRWIAWLIEGDRAQHFLGCHFFRCESWQWPPGLASRYGEAMGSSIVFADSTPLLAFALKPFEALLPERFQYTGSWLVACFALNSALACRAGYLATGRHSAALLLAAFALLSPVALVRAYGHFALVAHWLLWWALGNALQRPASWYSPTRAACLCMAALVHAYLLLPALALWSAEWWTRVVSRREWALRDGLVHAAITTVALVSTLWLAGYFATSGAGAVEDYARHAAPLDAYLAPVQGAFLHDWYGAQRQPAMEAGNYLGLGALILIVLALAATRAADWLRLLRSYWPVIAALATLFLLGMSHRVHLDARFLIEMPIPDVVLDRLATFRGAGRLLWLPGYALLCAAVIGAYRRFSPRVAAGLVSAMLLLQVADLSGLVRDNHALYADSFSRAGADYRELDTPFWHCAASRYARISLVPGEHAAPGWATLGLFAADHGLSIDVGQFARTQWLRFDDNYHTAIAAVTSGELREDTLYVLVSDAIKPPLGLAPIHMYARQGGFDVLAPKWNTPSYCATRGEFANEGALSSAFE